MIHFTCPGCNASLNVPDKAAGKKGACPKCGQRLLVPPPQRAPLPRSQTMLGLHPAEAPIEIAETSPPPAHDGPNDPSNDDPPPARMSQATKLGIIAMGIVFLATGIVAVIVTVKMKGESDSTAKPSIFQGENRPPSSLTSSPIDSMFQDIQSEMTSFFIRLVIGAVLYLLFWQLVMVWVARDAKNRSIDGGAVWVIVIFFTSFLGLGVYLASRPRGALTTCSRCNNRKLNYALICPHCGQSSA